MPVLTAPAARPTEIELPAISFFGRSLDEYVRCFSLDIDELRGRPVLDVAGGPSSFTAEACRRGIDAIAVDPLYGATPQELASRVQADHGSMFAQMRAKPALFKMGASRRGAQSGERRAPNSASVAATSTYFASLDQAEAERWSAAQRFLNDYESQFVHSRYLAAGLPRLPFFDGAFDLVLCAHLLFTYARFFDFEWHLAACRELARVSAGRCGFTRYADLTAGVIQNFDRLRRELLTRGVRVDLVKVNYVFFAGADSMLVLNSAS